jgi:tRNA dimethylallyltransferase
VEPILDMSAAERFIVDPERSLLYARIDARAETMIAAGAIDEVEALLALGLSEELPAMKAIGVRQLADHLAGKLPLDAALAGIRTETRRYAKRQLTWFRNQMKDWPRLRA